MSSKDEEEVVKMLLEFSEIELYKEMCHMNIDTRLKTAILIVKNMDKFGNMILGVASQCVDNPFILKNLKELATKGGAAFEKEHKEEIKKNKGFLGNYFILED